MKKTFALILSLLCLGCFQLSAQLNRKISGLVTDSAKTALVDFTVLVIVNKDTLRTKTDENGTFSFSKINGNSFTIQVSSISHQAFSKFFTFDEKEKHKRLDPFIMKPSGQLLKEVVISAKPNPIRFMQDTVEYNAGAFQVNEGDNVADLMKQFPGMEIDEDYNVKTEGKEMTKLRINGKDFFTNNVKDFIGKLPAGIVSKVQVIDDFGDEANFSGIKIGEPKKMLNIVTKPGMDNGVFGSVSSKAGTNDMVSLNGSGNNWNKTKQSSANASLSTLNNGAGNNRSINLGINHNDKIGKDGQGGFGYYFNNNSNAFSREQVIESINPEGNFITNTQSDGKNGGNNHRLSGNLSYNDKKMYLQGDLGGSFSNSNNRNISVNNQFGLIRQDLKNSNGSSSTSPNLNGQFNMTKKLKNTNNSFSVRTSFNVSSNKGTQNINTNTLYYDKTSGNLLKDSLLNRDLITENQNQNVSFGVNYSLGLKKGKDSLVRKSLNINYNGTIGINTSDVSTFVFDNIVKQIVLVDTLSTSFKTQTFNQSVGLNYNYNGNKFRYNLGLNAMPNMLSNHDLRLKQTTQNNTFNYSPNVNASKTLSPGKTISISYQGYNNNPSINQLQPIRNTQNLQNIVVGNPDLKSSFSHSANANFNYAHVKSGISVQTGLNVSATQREIVSHVILLPDTLNSLKQITRFENINGNYGVNGNYRFNIPLGKKKHSINYSGRLGVSNRAIIFNNQKAFGKGLNLSQAIGGNLSFKKFSLNSDLNYGITTNNDMGSMYRSSEHQPIGIGQIIAPAFFRTTTFGTNLSGNLRFQKIRLTGGLNYNTSHNNNTSGNQEARNISNLNMNLSAYVTVKKSYFINLNANKRNNYGYALDNVNPLIINLSLEKAFLKQRTLRMSISGNDLLGQGNNLTRSLSGNSIIDTRSKQQTRVFSLNLSYNLSQFGGRNFRVDPDF